ncbi:hypothetical protein BU16DRAFT_532521 [Lophium mytilinum]|uniref:Uncharacterized protein n=1 Tax=Lophium mytilinum TaxID=390894 RepID=A0A6A6REF7_9PEZI|nr:hypothetical protein BU16DRAFT_532521 [Lophium mytilinum]
MSNMGTLFPWTSPWTANSLTSMAASPACLQESNVCQISPPDKDFDRPGRSGTPRHRLPPLLRLARPEAYDDIHTSTNSPLPAVSPPSLFSRSPKIWRNSVPWYVNCRVNVPSSSNPLLTSPPAVTSSLQFAFRRVSSTQGRYSRGTRLQLELHACLRRWCKRNRPMPPSPSGGASPVSLSSGSPLYRLTSLQSSNSLSSHRNAIVNFEVRFACVSGSTKWCLPALHRGYVSTVRQRHSDATVTNSAKRRMKDYSTRPISIFIRNSLLPVRVHPPSSTAQHRPHLLMPAVHHHLRPSYTSTAFGRKTSDLARAQLVRPQKEETEKAWRTQGVKGRGEEGQRGNDEGALLVMTAEDLELQVWHNSEEDESTLESCPTLHTQHVPGWGSNWRYKVCEGQKVVMVAKEGLQDGFGGGWLGCVAPLVCQGVGKYNDHSRGKGQQTFFELGNRRPKGRTGPILYALR